MKPIDFIPNQIVYESFSIQLELRTAELQHTMQRSYYFKEEDPKWIIFARNHKLGRKERKDPKWFDLYLRLCAEGII